MEKEVSKFKNITCSNHQVCMFLLDIFNLYGENTFRELVSKARIKVDGYNINNIIYADDMPLVSDNEKSYNTCSIS